MYMHPLMHIVTDKNGMSKNGNIKSEITTKLEDFYVG